MPDTPGPRWPAVASSSPISPVESRAIRRSSVRSRSTSGPGKILWTKEWQTNYSGLQLVYAIGPRATPTVDGDRVYVLGAMGQLFALDVASGRVIWEKDYVKDFNASVPTWGMAGAPLVDGDRLICLVGGEPDAQADRVQQAHRRRKSGARCRRTPSPATTSRSSSKPAARGSSMLFHPKGISALDPVDRQGATGRSITRVADGHRRRDARAERSVSVRHLAVRRRAHAAGSTRTSRAPRCCGAAWASRTAT